MRSNISQKRSENLQEYVSKTLDTLGVETKRDVVDFLRNLIGPEVVEFPRDSIGGDVVGVSSQAHVPVAMNMINMMILEDREKMMNALSTEEVRNALLKILIDSKLQSEETLWLDKTLLFTLVTIREISRDNPSGQALFSSEEMGNILLDILENVEDINFRSKAASAMMEISRNN
ncbi:MAG: hypothetical protein KGP29_02375 [Proteobacteria bacterium]|nr:hypothetical protein [Pseudomonadota bacterium]